MGRLVAEFAEVGAGSEAVAGGKGAALGELSRIDGIAVPAGFVVTTAADPLGDEAAAEIAARIGSGRRYAVRSSATAEDGAGASFAGQHDTFLDVAGTDEVLRHVRKVQGSLATERAVAYRARHGIADAAVAMAVVVQEMVAAEAAGVLFTADPATGNRRVSAVDAVRGAGEDLLSGWVTPDAYTVRDGEVLTAEAVAEPVLADEQVAALERIGRRVEAHFGRPQDIEWCLAGGVFHVVQSRPITTLFPVPGGGARGVFVSVGHQQMMTDAMRPLGLSLWQLIALPVMHEAGGRLFVDIAPRLASPAGRAAVMDMLGTSDPLIGDALRTVVERGFVPEVPDPPAPVPAAVAAPEPIATDPAIVAELIARTEASVAAARRALAGRTGAALAAAIRDDVQVLKALLFETPSVQAIYAGIESTWWLNEHLERRLGIRNAADALTRSAPGNVTSEMGLALLDVADAIRPHPEVVAFLATVGDDGFLDRMAELDGGPAARDAIRGWLATYGMRCVGEIDITRPRLAERPSALVPLLLGHVRAFAPGEARRRSEAGRRAAGHAERDVLERLRALPGGEADAAETQAMIDRVRTFIGYREHPKFGIVCRLSLYKRALLEEARGLVDDIEDIGFLRFEELEEALRTRRVDVALVARRRAEHARNARLDPPRVITSEGEVVTGSYRRDDVPAGALPGLAVSSGTVEGRARVVLDPSGARDIGPGDILVTAFTDPSWSPLFVAVAGLVTEVGGLMTHGAVVAREYGLPAVVGVQGATTRIADGRRIRVHGAEGYVELLP